MRVCLAVLLVLLGGCRPPERSTGAAAESNEGVRVRLEAPAEPEVGSAVVRVYILGPDNAAITGADVTVTGTMTHAGMEPVISSAPAREDGLYATDAFSFTMAGDWVVQAEASLPDGSTVTGELPLTVPGN